MEESTQTGDSIHDRIMATLEPVEDVQTIQSEEENEPEEIETEEESVEEESEEEAPESDGITTEDLSSYLGLDKEALDLDEDGSILIKTKIDGEEGHAKLKDLVTSYQIRGHLDKQTKQVAEERKALQERITSLEHQASERINQLEASIQTAWAQLEQEDFSHLRDEDPAEWTARQREHDEKKGRLYQAYQAVLLEKQNQLANQQSELRSRLQEEGKKLLSSVEEWADPKKAEKEVNDIYSYLADSHGFSSDDLYGLQDAQGNYLKTGISDHRYLLLARKAMKYDDLMKTKPTVANKVAKAPKIVKPGQPKQESKNTELAKLKNNIKQSGGKGRSVAEYLIAAGKV